MPPTAKRQHFLPCLYLRNFVGPSPAGHLWTYDALKGTQRSSVPEQTAVESHFYSIQLEDGTHDTTIEQALSSMESAAAGAYNKLVNGCLPTTAADRSLVSTFIAFLYVRTPGLRRNAAELEGRLMQVMAFAYGAHENAFKGLIDKRNAERTTPLSESEIEDIRNLLLDPSPLCIEVPKERTLHVLAGAEPLGKIFFEMNWLIVEASQGYFITSDHPVVKFTPGSPPPPFRGDGGFRNHNATVTVPLSPRRLLLLRWLKGDDCYTRAGRQFVECCNAMRAAQSDRFIYGHIRDTRVARLASAYRDCRPQMTIQGMRPKQFANVQVARGAKPTR